MIDSLYISILIVILLASNIFLLYKNYHRQVMMDDIDKKLQKMIDNKLSDIRSVEDRLGEQLNNWSKAINSNNKDIMEGINKTINLLTSELKLIENQCTTKDKKIIELQNELYKTQNMLSRYRKKIKGGQDAI